jgi:hypothetical protein
MKKLFILIPIAVIVGCIGIFGLFFGIYALVTANLRSQPFFQQGVTMAQNDPAVIELLGSPVKNSFFVMGNERNFLYGGGYGNVDTIISGPKGWAILTIFGTYSQGEPWIVKDMTIRQGRIVILTYNSREADKGFQPYTRVP